MSRTVSALVAEVEEQVARGMPLLEVLKKVGMSRTTYDRIRHIKLTSEVEVDEGLQKLAADLLDDIDTGRTYGGSAYKLLLEARKKKHGHGRLVRADRPLPSIASPETTPDNVPPEKKPAYKALLTFAHTLEGATMHYQGVRWARDLSPSVTPQQAEELDQLLAQIKTRISHVQFALRGRYAKS